VSQLSLTARRPALAVDPGLPDIDSIRGGQTLYVVQCLPCHKLNGAGSSDLGLDLNQPMNATEYDPRATRADPPPEIGSSPWPGQRMMGLPPDLLSDHEIDLIIAYLKHMAHRKVAP
jgi:mono/diheme cytochrome c family protein